MDNPIAPQDQKQREDEIVKKALELMDDLVITAQGKSDFVLQNFVVNQHDTVPARKKQALLELQIRMFNIRRTQLMIDKLRQQIQEKYGQIVELEHNEEMVTMIKTARQAILEIEQEELRINLEEMDLARIGQLKEAETLYAIVQKYPKFTEEEYQADEVNYWMLRLGRQAMLDLNVQGRVGVGNADAIRMMELPEDDEFGVWLKQFSYPTNSPKQMVNHVMQLRLQQSEAMAKAMEQKKLMEEGLKTKGDLEHALSDFTEDAKAAAEVDQTPIQKKDERPTFSKGKHHA